LFCLLSLVPLTPAAAGPAPAMPPPAGKDWSNYGGSLTNQRYSTLNQINTGNVKDLKGAWNMHVQYGNDASSFEATPVVVNGVMYVTSGRSDVWALNAKTGEKKWEYHPNVDTKTANVCCGVVNRGVAVGSGKV